MLIAFALSYVLSWFGALYGLPELPEHELQLFMASHYDVSPFTLTDPRWYGGVDVAWRPPAFYAIVALLPIGMERAYALCVIASVLAFVFASAWLVREMAGRDVALLMALNPVLYLFAFGLGQPAFVAAVALGGLQLACGLAFLRTRSRFLLGAAVCASALGPLLHPLAFTWALASWLLLALSERRMLWGAVSLGASALVLAPFFAANATSGAGPVSHNKWLLLASVLVLAALPRKLAPVLLVACAYLLGAHASAAPVRQFREAVAAAEQALSKPEARGHRYLTLGLGSERLAMSRRTLATLADGGIPWHTQTLAGKPLPYDSIDALPLGTAEGRAVLNELLQVGGVRWVVSATGLSEPLLRTNGYRLAAAWGGGVVLWEKDSVEAVEVSADAAKPAPVSWTVSGPLLLALLLLCLIVTRSRAATR